MYLQTHTQTYLHIQFKNAGLPYDYRIPESSVPQAKRQCLLTAQIWCRAYCKAPVWSHRLRGQGQRDTHGGFAFCLKSNLLGNTLRSKGWERLCGQDMVDDLMVPAYCGKEGVIERGPRSVSHKVSVGSASKHLRKARVQHSE